MTVSNPTWRLGMALLLAAMLAQSPSHANLSPLTVSGRTLLAGGRAITLRGINWGWWHSAGTRYSKDDMRRQAGWGTNLVRLPVSYSDFVHPAEPGVWLKPGFSNLDRVLHWARKYHQYVIIDMHVVPGGQDGAPYCDGGANKVWSDAASQSCYLALWREMARRYRSHPEVAAYELLNEPDTGRPTPDALTELCQRVITAIREIDPNKIIVVPGDHWSHAAGLVDAIKLPDPNILYTFHFYEGTGNEHWISNDNEGPGISGTQDWTRVDKSITVPPRANSMRILLRSSENSGTAWFDDVDVRDEATQTEQSYTFDADSSGFQVERSPASVVNYDPAAGHGKPGSLCIHGTPDRNGWIGPNVPVTPGSVYHLSAWVKLADATGGTYLSAAFSAPDATGADKEELHKLMEPAALFSQKFDVPVWVGEFGCVRDKPTPGFQEDWVRNCMGLFEENGFNWTYWNYRETTGPESMALHAETKSGADCPVNQELLAALCEGWKLNGTR